MGRGASVVAPIYTVLPYVAVHLSPKPCVCHFMCARARARVSERPLQMIVTYLFSLGLTLGGKLCKFLHLPRLRSCFYMSCICSKKKYKILIAAAAAAKPPPQKKQA